MTIDYFLYWWCRGVYGQCMDLKTGQGHVSGVLFVNLYKHPKGFIYMYLICINYVTRAQVALGEADPRCVFLFIKSLQNVLHNLQNFNTPASPTPSQSIPTISSPNPHPSHTDSHSPTAPSEHNIYPLAPHSPPPHKPASELPPQAILTSTITDARTTPTMDTSLGYLPEDSYLPRQGVPLRKLYQDTAL